MRVLHINSYYSTGAFYTNLYDAQLARGLEIAVYVPVAENYDQTAIPFGPYACVSKNHGRFDFALFHLKHRKILRDARRKYDVSSYDILHAHTLMSNGYIAWQLHKETNVPYIVAVRDADVNVFLRYMPHLRPLAARILEGASRVIFLSETYRDTALRPYLPAAVCEAVRAKSLVLPNGIDAYWLNHPASARRLADDKRLRVLLVGALIRRKNVSAALETVRILREEGLEATLTVVGKAPNAAELQKVQSAPFATHLPAVPKEELLDIYRGHDLFLLLSRRETFGLVYAEAMSQGLPVVYSRGQGFDGQVPDGGAGYPVAADSPREAAQAIHKILADYENTSARCVALAARFDWAKIAAAYENLYGEIVAPCP